MKNQRLNIRILILYVVYLNFLSTTY
ncbi:putative membrane protein, partial [Yersinia pestis PY-58]